MNTEITDAVYVNAEPDWYELGTHDNKVINFEKAFAVNFDKPFDPKYNLYAFGASILFTDDNGNFSEEYDQRCPSLSLNTVSMIIEQLNSNRYNDKVTFISDLTELPFDAKLFYDGQDTFDKMKDCPKIIVTFENDDISKIYVYRMNNMFRYTNTLIVFNSLMKQKRDEIDRNMLVQNLFLTLSSLGNNRVQRTEGGIVVP